VDAVPLLREGLLLELCGAAARRRFDHGMPLLRCGGVVGGRLIRENDLANLEIGGQATHDGRHPRWPVVQHRPEGLGDREQSEGSGR
jgi:hypothetical protein